VLGCVFILGIEYGSPVWKEGMPALAIRGVNTGKGDCGRIVVNVGVNWANKDLVLASRGDVCVGINGVRVDDESLPTGLSYGDVVSLRVVGILVPLGLEFSKGVPCRDWLVGLPLWSCLYMSCH